MTDEVFVDTNILTYAFDESERQKRPVAMKIVEDMTTGATIGVVSNQVLAELFTVLTKKIEKPIQKQQAQIIINGLIDSAHWRKINYAASTVSKAMESSIKGRIQFWDALIAETMIENKVDKILTEDSGNFQNKKIIAENPFA